MRQIQYITGAYSAPNIGDEDSTGWRVVNVSNEFPENGYSYADMRAGLCRALCWVTETYDGDDAE